MKTLHETTCRRLCAKRHTIPHDRYTKLFQAQIEKARKDKRPSKDANVYKPTFRLARTLDGMLKAIKAATGETQDAIIARLIEKEYRRIERSRHAA